MTKSVSTLKCLQLKVFLACFVSLSIFMYQNSGFANSCRRTTKSFTKKNAPLEVNENATFAELMGLTGLRGFVGKVLPGQKKLLAKFDDSILGTTELGMKYLLKEIWDLNQEFPLRNLLGKKLSLSEGDVKFDELASVYRDMDKMDRGRFFQSSMVKFFEKTSETGYQHFSLFEANGKTYLAYKELPTEKSEFDMSHSIYEITNKGLAQGLKLWLSSRELNIESVASLRDLGVFLHIKTFETDLDLSRPISSFSKEEFSIFLNFLYERLTPRKGDLSLELELLPDNPVPFVRNIGSVDLIRVDTDRGGIKFYRLNEKDDLRIIVNSEPGGNRVYIGVKETPNIDQTLGYPIQNSALNRLILDWLETQNLEPYKKKDRPSGLA